MSKVIFLTGATGFVGSNLFPRILGEDSESKIVVLVRGESDGEARERFLATLRLAAPEAASLGTNDRVEVVRGDVTLDRMGFAESRYHELVRTVTHVIHSAANVQFHLPLNETRKVNLFGTRNVMFFARSAAAHGQLHRIAYVSTAYVSGMRTGRVYENELDCNQEFGNSYEQSKFEAESYVRGLMDELPITIFRPSIIVGDSRTGRTTAFNVLYSPLKLIYRRLLRIVPGSRKTPLDVVPVDYVSDAICHILLKSREGVGKTFHLTAGEEFATTTGEVVDLAVKYFNGMSEKAGIHHIAFLPLALFRGAKRFVHQRARRALDAMEAYIPYLCFARAFDIQNTEHALQGTNIVAPRFSSYYEAILRYCLDVNWGKRLKLAS